MARKGRRAGWSGLDTASTGMGTWASGIPREVVAWCPSLKKEEVCLHIEMLCMLTTALEHRLSGSLGHPRHLSAIVRTD